MPAGLSVKAETGEVEGICGEVGEHGFSVRVTDDAGETAERALSISVRERPNRRFELVRLVALMDGTNYGHFEPNLDPAFRVTVLKLVLAEPVIME